MTKLQQAVKEFFEILDIEEESMNGKVFRPNYIASCRVMDTERLAKVIKIMKEEL